MEGGGGRVPECPSGPAFISLGKGRLEPWEPSVAGEQTNKRGVTLGNSPGARGDVGQAGPG